MKQGKYPKDGLYFYDRIAGLLCQRLWCYGKTKDYSDKLKISNACTGCVLCVRICPMENLVIKNSKATAGSRCTMCYRCISSCPQQAITLLGNTVVEQCRYERYVERQISSILIKIRIGREVAENEKSELMEELTMNRYEEGMKLIEESCGNKKDNAIAL